MSLECVFMSVGNYVNVSECKKCVNVCPECFYVTTWTSVCVTVSVVSGVLSE